MPARKRDSTVANGTTGGDGEPIAKRRSLRQAAAAISASEKPQNKTSMTEEKASIKKSKAASTPKSTTAKKAEAKTAKTTESAAKQPSKSASATKKAESSSKHKTKGPEKAASVGESARAGSEDPDVDDIPTVNPEAPRHDGEWYWLLKAEPESRFENGVDVKFSIDDLRAKTKPEGWDGKSIFLFALTVHIKVLTVLP